MANWTPLSAIVDSAGNALSGSIVTAPTASVGASVVLLEATANGTNTMTVQGPASLAANRTLTFGDDSYALATIKSQAAKISVETAIAGANLTLPEGTDNGANVVILKAPASIASNRTHTLPDLADGDVLLTTGSQTVSGVKTFSGEPVLSAGIGLNPFITARTAIAGAKLTLAEGTDNGVNTVILKAPDNIGTSRTHTLPDLADGEVLLTTGSQTVTGVKTLAGATVLSGGLGSGSVFVSAEITGNGGAQSTAHGLGRTPTILFGSFTELDGNAADMGTITADGTNVTVTVTSGQKYKILAI